jgi:hypothetical protein
MVTCESDRHKAQMRHGRAASPPPQGAPGLNTVWRYSILFADARPIAASFSIHNHRQLSEDEKWQTT